MAPYGLIYYDRWARQIVRTDPPELAEHIKRVSGTDWFAVPTFYDFETGRIIQISMEYADGEYDGNT